MDDIELEAHKRRLSFLRGQAAYYGINCAPHILMEIEDIEKFLKKSFAFIEERVSSEKPGNLASSHAKDVIRKVAIITAGTAILTTLYLVWSYTGHNPQS